MKTKEKATGRGRRKKVNENNVRLHGHTKRSGDAIKKTLNWRARRLCLTTFDGERRNCRACICRWREFARAKHFSHRCHHICDDKAFEQKLVRLLCDDILTFSLEKSPIVNASRSISVCYQQFYMSTRKIIQKLQNFPFVSRNVHRNWKYRLRKHEQAADGWRNY